MTKKLTVAEATRLTGMTPDQVARLKQRLADPEKYRNELLGAAYHTAMMQARDNVRGTQGTGENEWFTPAEYLNLVRDVLGTIDLDPASSDKAQQVIQAVRYFTKHDDGLKHGWVGKVWLNPPYAQPLIGQFVSKLVAEHAAGRTTEAILLTHNYTDTAWFHEAASRAAAICFTRGRVKFYEPDGTIAAPTQGQAFSYFGSNVDGFAAAFGGVGFVATPYVWS